MSYNDSEAIWDEPNRDAGRNATYYHSLIEFREVIDLGPSEVVNDAWISQSKSSTEFVVNDLWELKSLASWVGDCSMSDVDADLLAEVSMEPWDHYESLSDFCARG